MNQQVENMKKLGFSDEEITEILETDKRIDRGEKLFELDPELEKGAKKARQADRKKTIVAKRERKPNEIKRELMELFYNALVNEVAIDATRVMSVEAYHISMDNPERELTFYLHGVKYRIVLSAPRS